MSSRRPSDEEILEAFDHPWSAPLSLPFAAAHLLADGLDGPALCELAGLPASAFDQALALLPQAAEEAAHVLQPLRERQAVEDDDGPPAVAVLYASAVVADRVDELADLVERLAAAVAEAGVGEVDGLCDEREHQAVLAYGPDVEQLAAFLADRVAHADLAVERVEVRGR